MIHGVVINNRLESLKLTLIHNVTLGTSYEHKKLIGTPGLIVDYINNEGTNPIMFNQSVTTENLFSSLTKYSHKSLVESGLFGFIQARLYGGEWNSKFEQDFSFRFVPKSWAWYAYLMTKTGFERLVYGEAALNKQGKWEKFDYSYKRSEFYEILHRKPNQEISENLSHSQHLICKTVPLRSQSKKLIILPNERLNLPPLTVFNSTSFAFPHLVSLFENEGKIESWIELYEKKHEGKLSCERRRILEKFLRMGYKQSLLNIKPHLLSNLPEVFEFDKTWDNLNKGVKEVMISSKKRPPVPKGTRPQLRLVVERL
jgi:hypothetical protein